MTLDITAGESVVGITALMGAQQDHAVDGASLRWEPPDGWPVYIEGAVQVTAEQADE